MRDLKGDQIVSSDADGCVRVWGIDDEKWGNKDRRWKNYVGEWELIGTETPYGSVDRLATGKNNVLVWSKTGGALRVWAREEEEWTQTAMGEHSGYVRSVAIQY